MVPTFVDYTGGCACSILSLPDTPRNTAFILSGPMIVDKLAMLPSWCKDYSAKSTNGALLVQNNKAGHDPVRAEVFSPKFVNSGVNVHLVCEGMRMDVIEKVAQGTPSVAEMELAINGHGAQILPWLRGCIDFSRDLFSEDEETPEPMLRTLVADVLDSGGTCSPDVDELIAAFRLATMWLSVLTSGETSIRISKIDGLAAQRFMVAMSDACVGRRLFSTFSGRVGVAAGDLTPGDVVCVLKNIEIPFIFRPAGEEGCYTLVGDAYVHGVMRGEIFEDFDRPAPWETISLV